MNNSTSKSMVMVAGIVALVLGGGIGYAAGASMDNGQSASPMANSKQVSVKEPSAPAADLRVGMNNLLREHVSSSLDVTRSIVDMAPQQDIDGAVAAQMANAGEIATAIGSVYGDEAKTKITGLFVDHIKELNTFASAVANGDEAAKTASLKEMETYLHEISAFFSGAIKDLPEDTVYGLLQKHEKMLNDSVTAYKNGDFNRSYEIEREALTQVSTIADALSSGVVASSPDKFNK